MKRIVVIVPVYNGEKTLVQIFKRIPKDAINKISEFIIVNDGSVDNTQNIIDSLRCYYDNLVVMTHSKNLGYGAAQKIGFKRALVDDMDIVVILHADGQYPPELILDIIEPVEEGRADIAIGSRFLKGSLLKQGMPLGRYIGKVILNAVENHVFKQNLTSYHEGYRCYNRKALEIIDFNSYSNYFSFDSEMLIGAFTNNLKICEIPIPTHYGQEECYLNPIRYIWEIFLIICKYLLGKYSNKKWQILF